MQRRSAWMLLGWGMDAVMIERSQAWMLFWFGHVWSTECSDEPLRLKQIMEAKHAECQCNEFLGGTCCWYVVLRVLPQP